MLETRKVDNNESRKEFFVRKPTSVKYVRDMRYAFLEKYSGTTLVRCSVVNK